ncbi:UNVERIFIED_CONTAM: Pentatricopeptide repeat-containing protein [Sesamum calycinum]|uniref:Pentatricopeptide repeat-containing protein n=1 Tax=Sesamum calycinum TaxID=2727403 RepID=A0AAW2J0Q5_9LAMI
MHNMFNSVVEMYSRMQQAFVSPDTFTFPHVLKACGSLLARRYGRAVHAQIFRHGLEEDVFVQNGLLSFYVKCDDNNLARVIFYGLSNRDVVSWTLIISGYAHNRQYMEALSIFRDMRRSDIKPDCIALVSVLKAYSDLEELNQGGCLHSLVIKMGHEFEPDLRIALTSLYAKCGQVSAAKSLFDQMKVEDVILWNAMISGFAKNGHANEALELFTEMISKSIQPDAVTIQSSALASAQLGSLDQARWVDNYVKNSKLGGDVIVSTALIDMYVKCGSVELARDVFNRTVDKDVVVWTAMIMGYGLHGWGREAINLFNEMKDAEVHPNDVTFLALITACSHCGLVEEGWEFFISMKDYGISVWGALLSACKIHRRVTLGEYAAEKLFSLDPLNTGHYVLLSNLYASARMWDGVAKVRVLMKSKGLNKDSGYSMIEIDGKLQAFRIGDKSHPRSDEIYKKLEWLEMRLLESGFVPDTESALHDLDKEDKELSEMQTGFIILRMEPAPVEITGKNGTSLVVYNKPHLHKCLKSSISTKDEAAFKNLKHWELKPGYTGNDLFTNAIFLEVLPVDQFLSFLEQLN